MIATAAIVWALVATGGAVAVYVLMRRQVRALDRSGYGQYARAEKLAGDLAASKAESFTWQVRAQAAEHSLGEQDTLYRAHMRQIGLKGNTSPKRRRAA